MTDDNYDTIDLHPSPHSFPQTELMESGIWTALSSNAKAVFGPLWDFHRKFPDACRPSRERLAAEAGISPPSVTKAVTELERIGLVCVLVDPGPRTNTYRLNWTGLRVPRRSPKPTSTSPFAPPKANKDADLLQDKKGDPKLVYTRAAVRGYTMSDGCVVRSAKEIHLHDYLVAWRIPHWCEVKYIDLGVRLTYPRTGDLDVMSTVDFVVGPRLLIEQVGLAKHQKAAEKYHRKLKRKLEAAVAAGWRVIRIDPEKRPDDWLFEQIAEHWATATTAEAEALVAILKKAGIWDERTKSCIRLMAHVQDANNRMTGSSPVRRRQGLYKDEIGPNLMPRTVRQEPKLCLMESACPPIVQKPEIPEPMDDLDFFSGFVTTTPENRINGRPPLTEAEQLRAEALRERIQKLKERIDEGDMAEEAEADARCTIYELQGELASLEGY